MARMEAETNNQTAPAWAGDFLDREHVVPGGAKADASAFNGEDAVVVTVGAAGAAVDDTTVPVDALPGAIPSGTVLDFGGKKFARLTAAAAAGAVSLTVAALATALVDNDTATYAGVKKKFIPSGTLVGRTIAERDAGAAFGPAADADDEVFLIVHDVTDADKNADIDLYRDKSIVKENYLPGISAMSATLKGKLRAKYICVQGVN